MPTVTVIRTIPWGGLRLEVSERRKESSAEGAARRKREASANDKCRADAEMRKIGNVGSEYADVYARINAVDFGLWFESITGYKWSRSWGRYFYKIKEELDWADGLNNEFPAIRKYAKQSLRDFSRLSHRERRKMRFALATPEWCDREAIMGVYAECMNKSIETGILHRVEHVIPIAGKQVCGLHVHTNLRVVAVNTNEKRSGYVGFTTE